MQSVFECFGGTFPFPYFWFGKFLIMQSLRMSTAFRSGYCLATVEFIELSFCIATGVNNRNLVSENIFIGFLQ
jgi:hypothetical protein